MQQLFSCSSCSRAAAVFVQQLFSCSSCFRAAAVLVQQLFSCSSCSRAAAVLVQQLFSCSSCSRAAAVLVHVGTNNTAEDGTSASAGKCRRFVKTLKIGQIVLSGILLIMGGRGEEYRNCRRMAINTQVQKVCMEEGVGFVGMWLNFVGRDDFFMRDGLHLTEKGAAFLGFVRVVDKGTVNYVN